MVMDTFKAYFTDNVAAAMLIGHTAVVKVPAGFTIKVQPLDVCVNKPFKSLLREFWEDHVAKRVKDAGDETRNNFAFKLSAPTIQNIVNWVHRGHDFLLENNAIIQRSFEVYGITTTNSGWTVIELMIMI